MEKGRFFLLIKALSLLLISGTINGLENEEEQKSDLKDDQYLATEDYKEEQNHSDHAWDYIFF